MFLPVVLSDSLVPVVPEAIPMLIAHARVDDHVPVPSADAGDGLNGFSDADAMDGAKHVAYECSKSAAKHQWGWMGWMGWARMLASVFSRLPLVLAQRRKNEKFVGHRVLKCVEM